MILYRGTNQKPRLFALSLLLAGILFIATAQAALVTVFSDDFNDNSLDATKWTTPPDVVGVSNAFAEQNLRAEFQTWGPRTTENHCYLNSLPITINGWDNIEITGKWTNNGYTSRTHIARVTDLDNPANTISIEYAAGVSQMFYYWKESSSDPVSAPIPSPSLVPFRLKITKTGFEYYENNNLVKSIPTSSMANSKNFQLQIGAWEYSSIISQTYIDDIVVQADIPKATASAVPEFPTMAHPAALIVGLMSAVLFIQKSKEE